LDQPSARVLVVDDDADTCLLIKDVLEEDGYDVQACSSGEQALVRLKQERFDLLLSDIRMPDVTGLDLLHRLRREGLNVKVILMTAYASLQTAIDALDGDAEGYLIKPFSLAELRQRARLALRTPSPRHPRHGIIHYENLSIDLNARRVWLDESEVALTPKEFDVLAYLAEQMGCAVSFDTLLQKAWSCGGSDGRTKATVRSCVRRLRRQLGDDGHDPHFIFNVWGVGYQFGK
jgi:DNA-binding response OmpR family regulator